VSFVLTDANIDPLGQKLRLFPGSRTAGKLLKLTDFASLSNHGMQECLVS